MNRGLGSVLRVQNANTLQTVKSTAGILHRLILSNADFDEGTLTVKDGSSTLIVLNVPASTAAPVVVDCGFTFNTSLTLTPSAVGIDVLAIYV